jgi:hypothetical protein
MSLKVSFLRKFYYLNSVGSSASMIEGLLTSALQYYVDAVHQSWLVIHPIGKVYL